MHAEHVPGHLKAVARTEDEAYQCLLVAAQGRDISGAEFVALIRAREKRRSLPPVQIVLLGAGRDLVSLFSGAQDIDDYLSVPWMDVELEWKVKQALRRSKAHGVDAAVLFEEGTGLLTAEGLRVFLYEEVNRVGRRQGWISLSMVSIAGLDGFKASYGRDWTEWFNAGVWSFLRRQLRNYDRLASLGEGLLCLVSPDLEEAGTRALLKRLSGAVDDYQLHDGLEQSMRISLAARYLCVQVLGDYRQFGRTGDALWNWVRARMGEPMPVGIFGCTGTVTVELECQDPSLH